MNSNLKVVVINLSITKEEPNQAMCFKIYSLTCFRSFCYNLIGHSKEPMVLS